MKYALTNCNILDGTEEMVLQKDRTVIIEDGRIISIEKNKAIPSDAKEINIEHKYLLPGLINLHAHLLGNGKPHKSKATSILTHMTERSKFLQVGLHDVVKNNILTQLYSGVTTIRSLGEICHLDLKNRELIESGGYIGPRLLVAGNGVTVPHGHMAGTMAIECTSVKESQALVEAEIKEKVDWIKLFITGGVLDATSSDKTIPLKMPFEMAEAVCKTAHALGYKVAAHAESQEGVRLALKAGVDTIEHGFEMDQEIISLYKRNQAAMIATLSPALTIAKLPLKVTGMTKAQREVSRYLVEHMISGVKQALDNGIPVGIGTDCSTPYVTQYDMWREIYYFAKYCNVSNAFALYTATLKNAQILGIDKETGSIEVGKSADLIITKQNPLEDLTILRHIESVIVKGHIIQQPKKKIFIYCG